MFVEGKQMHIQLKQGDVGKYVIIPGDPGRSEKIARLFDEPRFLASNREFTSWNGTLLGETVTVCSTGIGGPSAAIAVEELTECGATTFIRVGTCGGIDTSVQGGDMVIATGSVRQEGTSREYLPLEFPAVPDFEVTLALRDGARALGRRYHTGVVQAKDSFYGQHRPQAMPIAPKLEYQWEAWKKGGVLCSEMESAALFTVASTLRVRAGAAFHVLWNQERRDAGLDDPYCPQLEPTLEAVIEGLKLLIRRDRGENV